jgi:DNA processing protein
MDVPTTSAQGLLTLLALRGVGPQTAERLGARFSTLRELREKLPTLEGAVPANILKTLREDDAWITARGRANDTLEQADRLGVRVLTIADDDYPHHLRAIPDRPLVVYVRGRLPPSRRCVACIGTREPSIFGETVARRIAGLLAECGWSIISGLAIGVDAISHEAALEARGHTVAVLANGLDTVYPRKNAALAERILDNGGAWLSEQPFGTPAIARHLIHRDRLQSGMSIATIVMQTDIVGGSMHTVRYTLLQGRLLVAPVPQGAHVDEPKSRGIVALTKQTGTDLSHSLDAQGSFAELLKKKFADRPVAMPLLGRDEYARFLKVLESVLGDGNRSDSREVEVPVPDGIENSGTRAPQLGLSLN